MSRCCLSPLKRRSIPKLTEKFDKKPSVLLRELAYKYIQDNADEKLLQKLKR